MIDHFSYSALRTFFTCPSAFKRRYIDKEIPLYDKKAFLLGKAYHLFVENMLRGKEYDDCNDIMLKLISDGKEKIKVLDSDKFDKELGQLTENVKDLYNNKEEAMPFTPLEIEVKLKAKPFDEYPEIVGVCDVITSDFNVIDHKYITRYATERDTYQYYIQAWFYYKLIIAKYDKTPEYFEVLQMKKSKNRDKSPQLKSFKLYYSDIDIAKLDQWYKAACVTILNTKYYIPNPFGMFEQDEFIKYMV